MRAILLLVLLLAVGAAHAETGPQLWARIAACSSPCVVDVAPGLYLVNETLEISPSNDTAYKASIVIHGAGGNTTVIRYTGPLNDDGIIRWRGWPVNYTPGPKVIEGLTFDGNGLTQYGLAANDAADLTYRDLIVEGYRTTTDNAVGIIVGLPRRVTIEDSLLMGGPLNTAGVWVTNMGEDVLVRGNRILNQSHAGIILEDHGRSAVIAENVLDNNYIGIRTVSGVAPPSGYSILMGNLIRNSYLNCYQFDNNTSAIIFMGNLCDGGPGGWTPAGNPYNSSVLGNLLVSGAPIPTSTPPPPPVNSSFNVTLHLTSAGYSACWWDASHGGPWSTDSCDTGFGTSYSWVQANVQQGPTVADNEARANSFWGSTYQQYLNLFWGGT